LREIESRCGRHRRHEIIAGHRLAVVALEVNVHAFAEGIAADQRLDHAHHLGALLVNRGRVEVVDLKVDRGPYGMRHRTGILGELHGAQAAHFANACGFPAVRVGAEFLVAKNG